MRRFPTAARASAGGGAPPPEERAPASSPPPAPPPRSPPPPLPHPRPALAPPPPLPARPRRGPPPAGRPADRLEVVGKAEFRTGRLAREFEAGKLVLQLRVARVDDDKLIAVRDGREVAVDREALEPAV